MVAWHGRHARHVIDGQLPPVTKRWPPRSTWAARASVIVLVALASPQGCNCSEGGPDSTHLGPWVCEDIGRRPGAEDVACDNSQRYTKGECVDMRCDSGELAPNCCPGLICTQGGECRVPPSRVVTCESDTQCDISLGQHCLERPLVALDAKTCGFVPVDAAGNCPMGTQPFNTRCVAVAPCNGGCDAGKVCNVDLDLCETAPTIANDDGSCAQSCGDAQILVYADPNLMIFDQCCAVQCTCATVPPLPPGNWGAYADLAQSGESLFVAAYDTTYGDLVVATHGILSGDLEAVAYVDGFPQGSDVTPVANPSGPRGGLAGPGPDVGKYAAISHLDGAPRVSYYDIDNGDLKYAAFDGEGWSVTTIDNGAENPSDPQHDVGRYTSLVIDTDGVAHVTYYGHRRMVGGNLATGPLYARTSAALPSGPDDWERVAIETIEGCAGCADGEHCVLDGATPTCLTTATDCSAPCLCDQVCVHSNDDDGSKCLPALAEQLIEPCDAECDGDTVCVSSDQAGPSVCLKENRDACDSCQSSELCVETATDEFQCRLETPYSLVNGLPKGVGLFTSAVVDSNGTVWVAYYDRLRHHLRGAMANFTASESVAAGFTATAIDCAPGGDVGQHSSLAEWAGGLSVAYQGNDGETLLLWSGASFSDTTATIETIDDGQRETHPRDRKVGAYAELAYDGQGIPFVAYADQDNNDLLLRYRSGSTWKEKILYADGAFGSFAGLLISGKVAYASTYQRKRDPFDRDESQLLIQVVDLNDLD